MAQLSPTTLYLAQAAKIIEFLKREFAIKQFKSNDEIVEAFNKALTTFEESVGKSLTHYEPITMAEVPDSTKNNRFWNSIQTDLAILQDQADLLTAAAIDLHNFFKSEILKAREDNLVSQNKIKTLEMYSNISDQSLLYFGDSFITEELIDWEAQSSGSNRLEIIGKQSIGLGVEVQENAFDNTDATIKILEGSNGFLGNNQEIVDPQAASTTNPTTSEPTYFFRQAQYQPDDLDSIIDGEPTSWIEFEKYSVNESDKVTALNFNFNYKYVELDKYKYLKPITQANDLINWADGVSTHLLLHLEIDLKRAQRVNLIKLLPYGLQDNINYPIHIRSVSTSLDKTLWYELFPKFVYLANGIDRKIVGIDAYHIFIGEGAWTTTGDPIRFIRFEILQETPVASKIGHHYYTQRPSTTTGTNTPVTGKRLLGPIPTIDNTARYMDGRNMGGSQLVQKTEYFNGKRWAIGIRDISVYNNIYYETGTFVSKRFEVGGVVDRVSLDAEVQIPEGFDPTVNWIQFYISPNDGDEWFQISRIQDDFLDIPEIIAFNDPTPQLLRDPGIGYYEVDNPVTSLRLKVEITRPDDLEYSTPLLKPYTLKVKKRV